MQKCYLEVYSPHNTLKNSNPNYWAYWEEYKNTVISDAQKLGVDEITPSFIKERIKPYMNQSRGHFTKHYKLEGDTMYVYNDELTSKYSMPDTWVSLFNPDEMSKSITAASLEGLSKEDLNHLDMSFKALHLTSTVGLAKTRLKDRIEDFIKGELYAHFIKFCEELLEWLNNFSDNSIIVLYSGDIYFDDSVCNFVSLNPFEDILEYVNELKDFNYGANPNYQKPSEEVLKLQSN